MIDTINNPGLEEVDWVPLDFSPTALTLKLKFEAPLSISTSQKQSLYVTVHKPELFITHKAKFLLDGYPEYTLAKEVPTQLKSEEDQAVMA